MLLVLGQYKDNHVSRVLRYLTDRYGIEYFLIDRYAAPPISLEPGGLPASLSRTGVIWRRVKPPMDAGAYMPEGLHEQYFFQGEWGILDQYLISRLPRAVSINAFHQDNPSTNKLVQLERAEALGWTVPDTMVSTDVGVLSDHFAGKELVFKQLSGAPAGKQGPLRTTSLSVADLQRFKQEVSRCPGIFQERIAKASEWRVNVFGEQVFAVEVSQSVAEKFGVDWRLAHMEPGALSPIEVRADLQDFCIRYLKSFGMQHGVFDFAVDQEGRVIFLECNPYGQYTFVEDASGQPLSAAMGELIMSLLAGPAKGRRSPSDLVPGDPTSGGRGW
jgi:hypothetical protein